MIKFTAILFCLLATLNASAQSIIVLDSVPGISLRGLSVVDDNTVWASGSKGHVLRSVDGGKSFQKMQLKGYEKSDFRDIEAFSKTNAVIMSSGTPALILRTTDGGITWKEHYRNNDTAIFLDAMEWWDEGEGFVAGDPIAGGCFVFMTSIDSGKTWKQESCLKNTPNAEQRKEAAFAASGTCLRKTHIPWDFLLVTGGERTQLWQGYASQPEGVNATSKTLPLAHGKAGAGAFSVAQTKGRIVIVGGDYENPSRSDSTAVYTAENVTLVLPAQTMPGGYRSCVEFIGKNKLLCTGPTGTDISTDGGLNWKPFSSTGFHVVRKAKKGKAVFFAGSNGRVGKMQ